MDIKIENLTKAYGNEVIYRDFSIKFPENKITGIMGPSGSGKTTLLNLLAGVTAPDSGIIEGVEAVSYTHLDVYKRQGRGTDPTSADRTH